MSGILTLRAGLGALLLCACACASAEQAGIPLVTSPGKHESTASLHARRATGAVAPQRLPRLAAPDRSKMASNPKAPSVAHHPEPAPGSAKTAKAFGTALAFDAATLAEIGRFPPDTMGSIGPTQFVAFVNGRIRSFTKAGTADGVLDIAPDTFFASVMTPVGGAVLSSTTMEPQVRYDRFSARWFLTVGDFPCTDASCTTTVPNRVLIAVSDAASNGVISPATVWTFFQFQADPGTQFCGQPSLGIDVNALYIGCIMYSSGGAFVGTNGYVVQKSSVLGAGPPTVTAFTLVAGAADPGPGAPRGVDNHDASATDGYFVGADNQTFSTIMFRRVSNPGSATPTISANISVTVPTTNFPNRIEHLGNTGGTNGQLSSLDDRLYAAMIRNGRLWTAHNFRVSAAGVANTGVASRNGVRWYEFQNLATAPSLAQWGTVHDNAAARADARQYWMPSVAVTGQGHSVIGMSMAGSPVGATPVYVSRLANDALGAMNGPPSLAATAFGTTTANYNPPADPGGAGGRRWGSYSFTSVDPLDDMTVWTIQQYNQAENSYAVRVARIAAPPPATPTCSDTPIAFTGPTGNVVINATSSSGSGFYDPGADLPSPARPFTHLGATVSNATVNSVTYNSPTQVTLNITATTPGLQDVTLTNPDGQSVTVTDCIDVQAVAGDLAITLTDGVTTATPGGSTTYTITASNAGPGSAVGATVSDTFPAALTCTWTCVGAGGGTCTAAGSGNISDTVNLPAGGSVTYTASCAISASATGTLSNTATVTAPADLSDPASGNNSATDTTTLAASADFAITMTDGVATATPGGSTTYTIVASNAGPSAANGATVNDTFPAALTCTWTCVGAGGGTCTAGGSGNIADTVNLPAGGSVTYTASCAISASATGTLGNTATVTAPVGVTDPTPGNNAATDTDTLAASADLAITTTDGVATATPGGSTTYTITASNAGPSSAFGATLSDTFPAALTCTWTCVGAGGGTCTAAGSGNIADTVNLPASGSVTYTASCAISASATGTLGNTATVTAPAGVTDPTPGNNAATDTNTLTASADLVVTMTDGVATATPGGSTTYTIVASNAGPSAANGATVDDTFPAALTCTWTCVGAGGGTCTAAGSGNIADTVNLPAGGSVTYTASCAISASATGTLGNTATVTAPAGVTDPTPGNNAATDTNTLAASADLAITTTDGVATATPGGSTTYTIVASNAGPSAANGATVDDTFPAALTCTWTCVGAGGGTCTAGGSGNIADTVNLPAGGSVTYTASCAISASATGTLGNTATVTAPAGVTDPTPGNNAATDTDTLVASADLAISKSDGVAAVTPGGSTTYTITASNAGPSSVVGATVNDTFPAACQSPSWTCAATGGGGCTASGTGHIADTVDLPVGGSVTYAATCTIDPAASGTLVNTAALAGPVGVSDPDTGNNAATDSNTITVLQADLSMTLAATPDPVVAGDMLTYTATLANAGPNGAEGATLSLPLPAGTGFVSAASDAGGSCTTPAVGAAGTVTCSWATTTASGSSRSATVVVAVAPDASGPLSATASASSDALDPVMVNNTATATTTLTPADADLVLALSATPTSGNVGDTITLTATSTNHGPGPAQDVVVSLVLPAALRFASVNPGAGGSCVVPAIGTSGNIVCTYAGSTAAGSTRTVVATATAASVGSTSVLASTSSSTTDPTPGNAGASESILLGAAAAAAPAVVPAVNTTVLAWLGLLLGMAGLVAARRRA